MEGPEASRPFIISKKESVDRVLLERASSQLPRKGSIILGDEDVKVVCTEDFSALGGQSQIGERMVILDDDDYVDLFRKTFRQSPNPVVRRRKPFVVPGNYHFWYPPIGSTLHYIGRFGEDNTIDHQGLDSKKLSAHDYYLLLKYGVEGSLEDFSFLDVANGDNEVSLQVMAAPNKAVSEALKRAVAKLQANRDAFLAEGEAKRHAFNGGLPSLGKRR